MNKTSLIYNIMQHFQFLQDSKSSLLNNLEEVIQNIAPYVRFIDENNGNLDLNCLHEVLQYELKTVMLLTNVTLITMEFLKRNRPPNFDLNNPLLRDRRNERVLSPEERALTLLYSHLEQPSPRSEPTFRHALEYDRSGSNRGGRIPLNIDNLVQVNPHLASVNNNNGSNTVITATQSITHTHSRTIECTNPVLSVIRSEQSLTESNTMNPAPLLHNSTLSEPEIVRGSADANNTATHILDYPLVGSDFIEDSDNSSEKTDLSSIKENMKKLSMKLASLNSKATTGSERQPKSIPRLNYVYQLPEKDIPTVTGFSKVVRKDNGLEDDSSEESFRTVSVSSHDRFKDDDSTMSAKIKSKEADVTVSRDKEGIHLSKTNQVPKSNMARFEKELNEGKYTWWLQPEEQTKSRDLPVQLVARQEDTIARDSNLNESREPKVITEEQKQNYTFETDTTPREPNVVVSASILRQTKQRLKEVQEIQQCPVKTESKMNETKETSESKAVGQKTRIEIEETKYQPLNEVHKLQEGSPKIKLNLNETKETLESKAIGQKTKIEIEETKEQTLNEVHKIQECSLKTTLNLNEIKEMPESKAVSQKTRIKNEETKKPPLKEVHKILEGSDKSELNLNETKETPEAKVAQVRDEELLNTTQVKPVKLSKKVQFTDMDDEANLNNTSSVNLSQAHKASNLMSYSQLLSNNEPSTNQQVAGSSAINKLHKKLSVEMSRKKQEADKMVLPELLLLPEESPSVIRNNLDFSSKKKKKSQPKEKECNDKINELKKATIPVSGNWCVFGHIESPFEFYIQIVSEESIALDELTERVNRMYRGTSSSYTSKNEAMADLGQVCCAYIGDQIGWFRVRILDWLPDHATKLMVQAVDYGFKYEVPFNHLRKITKDLAEVPILAVRCHFPLLFPPDSTYKVRLTEWPDSTITCLREICGLSENNSDYNFKLFTVTFAQQIDDSVAIDMFSLEDGSETITVGQTLIDLKLAVQIMDEYDDDLAELDYMLEDIDDMERADNITEALLGYDAQDEARLCPFTRNDGKCFKGNNCKLEHRPFSKDGFTTDKVPVFCKSMNELLVPTKGEICQILVTESLDSCTFYAQIVRTPHKTNKYVMDKDFYELLETMNNKKNISTYKQFKVWPAVGEVVIAKHVSSKWLRGIIRGFIFDNDEPSRAQVYMVDFGEIIDLPLSELREMKECYLQLPFQLVHMYLYNYQQRADCNLQKSQMFFRKFICRCNFLAEIMSNTPPYRVKLTTFKGTDIGITLEREGFAKKRTKDTAVSDETSVLLAE